MKIKAMLARLQAALGQPHLIEQMVLSTGANSLDTAETHSDGKINLVIGYNGSPNSQVALDLTLWIAHQTRLATQKQVMVHVVYVVDQTAIATRSSRRSQGRSHRSTATQMVQASALLTHPAVHTQAMETYPLESLETIEACFAECTPSTAVKSTNPIEQADCILWQARCLAEEWRGSLEAHLRFGSLAAELRGVVQEEKADLLLLGCSTAKHSLVRQLSSKFPCPILGIPSQLEDA